MAPVIELAGVSKVYGDLRAVDAVDFSLKAGECVALAGHNGAGKSTLVKLILGLIRPSGGNVLVLGAEAGATGAGRADIGYLPEDLALHPAMTGSETLAFYAKLKTQPAACVAPLLERVGIAHAAQRRVGGYSKGMRQRLGLAQALLGPPKILLLDEPTSGLDPASRQAFYGIVRELRDSGVAVLMSSHALAELEGEADRIVIMNRGRKTADGGLAELRRLAALPTRIRIRLAADEPLPRAISGWARVGERTYQRACPEDEKTKVIQGLAVLGVELEDVEITAPGLDDIYAHFLNGASA